MNIRAIGVAAVVGAGVVAVVTAQPTARPAGRAAAAGVDEAAAKEAFSKIKSLAGEWRGKGRHGEAEMDAKVVYRITSGGSAVVETLFPGSEHEMVSIYTMDRGAVVMTHYCSMGNQPHLKLAKAADGVYSFEFVSGGNLASRDDAHMDSMVLTVEGEDHIKAVWTSYEAGKSAGTAEFDLERAEADGEAGGDGADAEAAG